MTSTGSSQAIGLRADGLRADGSIADGLPLSGDHADAMTVDLDRFRHVGDPLADSAVAAFFAEVESTDPSMLFGRLVRHTKLPPEEMNPALRAFFEAASARPDWVDEAAVARGQEFFNRLVAHQFSALYLASLPNSYAAAKGVQVLRMTGRLQTDTTRRLDETAQLLMDVAAPGALRAGGVGVDRVLHVRLMHAAVRWMILHDPSVRRVDELAPPVVETNEFVWSRSWGVPVNQEDLAGTWLTFTTVVYDAFDASGVVYDADDVADHLHMWRLIGHHLGLVAELLPLDRTAAHVLRRRIFARQQHPSGAGRAMTAALIEQSRSRLPRVLWPVMPVAFRHFLGDRVSDMIAIPPGNSTAKLFPALCALSRLMTRGADRHRLHAALDAFIGRHLMDGLLTAMRGGERPGFQIPVHLAADGAHASSARVLGHGADTSSPR